MKASKTFFFEKKNQKTSGRLGQCPWRRQSPAMRPESFFASFFSKKEVLPVNV
jgi:hypothetical protein